MLRAATTACKQGIASRAEAALASRAVHRAGCGNIRRGRGILLEQRPGTARPPRDREDRTLIPKKRTARLCALAICLAALLETGCGAAYSGFMKSPLKRLERGDYDGALDKLQKPAGDTDMLLYRLERGLILHYQGKYEASDRQFEKAERLIDKHFTRSVVREVGAFLTNDAVRAYSGEEYERALIHYYRALNSLYLGDTENALVECRKANLRLRDFAAEAEYELTYRNDAFLQYLTGLLYEAEGEWNDAYISYKDALKGYGAYRETFGMKTPTALQRDITELAMTLGYEEDVEEYSERFHLQPDDLPRPQGVEVIVFAESGFIARKRQREISMPILEEDDGPVWKVSEKAVRRYHHPRARYHKVDYWLRVALPEYEPVRSQVAGVRISGAGSRVQGVLMEDLDAIAIESFAEKEGTVLLRTVARALAKYLAVKKIEEESSVLGSIFNLLGSSVEAADTRGWLSLPKTIWMVRLWLPPGTVDLDLEFLNAGGRVVDSHRFEGVELQGSRPVVLSHRSFH